MRRELRIACVLIGALAVLAVPFKAFTQQGLPPGLAVTFSPPQLDQMLAPIALYPDSLLAQILIAATYPDQVMDAYLWLRTHRGLRGPALNAALDRMAWDLSIKALIPFPQVLSMMAQEPEWTQRLGEAFLAQEPQVMDSIQRLRRRAWQAGNLRPTPEQRVIVRQDYIEIQPADPEVVYIPRYNPAVVYGPWWWPAYPPFTYYPVWPGVAVAPLVGALVFWGAVTVGPVWGWGWGSWRWRNHNVYLNLNRTVNINTRNVRGFRRNFRTTSLRRAVVSGRFGAGSPIWRHARMRVMRNGGRFGAGAFANRGRRGSFGRSATFRRTGGGRPRGRSVRSFGGRRGGNFGGGFNRVGARVFGGFVRGRGAMRAAAHAGHGGRGRKGGKRR